MRRFLKVIPLSLTILSAATKSFALPVKQPTINRKQSDLLPLQSSTNCRSILQHFEKTNGIPDQLLTSIAVVESRARPFAVNANGKARYFSNKKDAVAYVKKLRQDGLTNIGVGCMQIDLKNHGKHFRTLDDALDPYQNIAYAARLFMDLKNRFGSWENAVKYYHSANEVHHIAYHERVVKIWSKMQRTSLSTLPKKLEPFKVGFGPGVGVSRKK
jgi:soluble lytic murein transglycosylase-like protein